MDKLAIALFGALVVGGILFVAGGIFLAIARAMLWGWGLIL